MYQFNYLFQRCKIPNRAVNRFILLALLFGALAIQVKSQSTYKVTHYKRALYKAGSQNWSAEMDSKGYLYVANNEGLLRYDGVRWQLYAIPNSSVIRSVSVSKDGRIYVGANEEFGYFEANNKNELQYTSLCPLIKGINIHNHEIWRIIQHNDKIYFQGFSCLYVYDHKTVKPIRLPASIVFLLKAGNRLFTQSVTGKFYEFQNNTFTEIPDGKILAGAEVKTILPLSDGSFLIGTSSKGLFIMKNKSITPWDISANTLLKDYQINNGILFNNHIVLGTIVKGILILDLAGNVVSHLHAGNDLQNNTVLALYNDNNKSIWVALDNGIDNLTFNNPVEVYSGPAESIGAVYTAAMIDNTLYIGTNRGIFTYKQAGNRFDFESFVNKSQGQVWQLTVIDGKLYCGHNFGTALIEGNSFSPLTNVSGGYMLIKITDHGKDYLIQSTYTTLVVYKKLNNQWVYSHEVEGLLEPARFIESDHLGNIWVAHSNKGLYKIRLSEGLRKVTEIQKFDQSNGLPSLKSIKIFKLNNRVVFSNSEKLFTWDDINRKIIPFDEINNQLGDFAAVTSITRIDDNRYWITGKTEAALFKFDGNKPIMQHRIILSQYGVSMIDGYENIISLSSKLQLICLDEGFAVFNTEVVGGAAKESFQISFRDVVCNTSTGTEMILRTPAEKISLNHAFNNITISFASKYNPCSHKLFQWKLEGIDTHWCEWSESGMARYTRLPVGKYIFKVRTLTANGNYSNPEQLTILVRQAWYATGWAVMMYFILGTILLFGLLRFNRLRIERKHEKLRKVADEKREYEKHHSEQEIMRLQNEKLQAQISHKTMQLADSTMSVIKKNEVLIEIKNELEKQKEELGTRYPMRYLNRLTTLIEKNISNDNDWEIFEALFDQAHENFFKRLKQSYPELTQSDLKLCAYLKLNLASKEIAPLLNISIRGVEIRRYRLRKRLGLPPETNLSAFIMQF